MMVAFSKKNYRNIFKWINGVQKIISIGKSYVYVK